MRCVSCSAVHAGDTHAECERCRQRWPWWHLGPDRSWIGWLVVLIVVVQVIA